MDTDEELYRRVRRGDLAAFDRLYERYEKRLFGFTWRILRSREDAEEVFHDAFLGVLESREVELDRASFSTWIHRIARNLCLNRLRAHKRGEAALAAVSAPSHPLGAEDRLAERELSQALEQAVSQLSPPLSEVFHLRTAGLSYEEMASALDVPVGTVKSRMHQMVNQLKGETLPWIVGHLKKS